MHEVAVIRQFLYDIDWEVDVMVKTSLPIPVRMTREQEVRAKERLSIKR